MRLSIIPNLYAEQECDCNAGSIGARINKDRQWYCGSTGCRWKIYDKREDGTEDGGECRNPKCVNVGTMTGKGRELSDMMVKRKIEILCVQETR